MCVVLRWLHFCRANRLATAFYACVLAWLPRLVVLRGASFRNSFRDGILTLFALLVAWLAITSLLAESPSTSLTFLRRHHLRALILACIAADVLRDPKRLRFFCVFLACLAFALCALETVTIAGLLRANAEWVLRYGSNSVREFGPGLVFCLPFLLVFALRPHARVHRAWIILGILYAGVMIALTGARGAWLATTCALIAVATLRANWRVLLIFVPVVAAFTVLAQTSLGGYMLKRAMNAGWSASDRIESTWGPAYEMAALQPLRGYGVAPERFHTEFRRQRPTHPKWKIPESIGPHSMYLEVAFAGGIPALLVLLALLARACMVALRHGVVDRRKPLAGNMATSSGPDESLIACALLASLVASYLIFGIVESLLWEPLGILLGAIVACTTTHAKAVPAQD